jgi:hypothetical protein
VEKTGGFEVRVGSSSRDIRLTGTLQFSTGQETSELAKESYPPFAKHHEDLSTESPKLFGGSRKQELYETLISLNQFFNTHFTFQTNSIHSSKSITKNDMYTLNNRIHFSKRRPYRTRILP